MRHILLLLLCALGLPLSACEQRVDEPAPAPEPSLVATRFMGNSVIIGSRMYSVVVSDEIPASRGQALIHDLVILCRDEVGVALPAQHAAKAAELLACVNARAASTTISFGSREGNARLERIDTPQSP